MVRVGIVGAGGMGNVHARHYRNMPDVELRFFDRDPAKRPDFSSRHQIEPASSWADLLAWADAIDICLPTDLHLPIALEAFAAGKHVLCEKPMALNVEEAVQMMQAAESAGVLLVPAQVVRYFPEWRRAHEKVSDGSIGTPKTARIRRGGKAPLGSEGWFQDLDRSGGVLLDLAVHDFDWLRWTLGEVRWVTSRSVRMGQPALLAGTPGDYALTTLTFDSGAIAHVESTWLDPSGFRTTLEVCGTSGQLEFDSRKIAAVRRHAESGTQSESPMASSDDPYFRQGRAFVDTIRNKTAPPVTALDGVMAVSIARAALQSAKLGRSVAPARHF